MPKLPENKVHVYFYALPVNTIFTHKEIEYIKKNDDEVIDENGKLWNFECHYGCVLNKYFSEHLNISISDHRPI